MLLMPTFVRPQLIMMRLSSRGQPRTSRSIHESLTWSERASWVYVYVCCVPVCVFCES